MTTAPTDEPRFGRRQAPAASPPAAPVKRGRTVPIWPIALAVLVVELVLQWLPFPGVILMMFGAPLWSVVLVNLVLVLFAFDAWRGAMPRWLMAVPAAIYLAYFAAAVVSYFDYRALADDVARQNAAQILPFDPAREALVVAGEGGSGRDEELVLDYRLPVVFDPSRNTAPASHLSVRAALKPVCDKLSGDPGFGPVQVMGAARIGRSYENLCIVRMFEDPAAPTVSLSWSHEAGVSSDRLLQYTMTTLRAVGPDGRVVARRLGAAGVLSPIPAPVIGCVLNDAANRWQCMAELVRLPQTIGGQASANPQPSAGAVAAMLGLQPRTLTVTAHAGFLRNEVVRADPGEFDSAAAAQMLATADTLQKAQTQADIAMLPAYLAGDNHVRIDASFATAMARHADQVTAFADPMRAAYGEAVETGQSNRIYTLGAILAALPGDAFARVGPQLLSVAQRQAQGPAQGVPETLIARFGDLAPVSLPYLREQLAGRDGMAIDGAILALCRAGAVAQADGPAIIAALRHNSGFQSREAAFIALRRMGRPDLAQTLAVSPRAYEHAFFEGDAASVTPASPRTVCRLGAWTALSLPDVAWLR